MTLEHFLGSNIFTRILFFSALLIVVGDIIATLFTILYQRFLYDRVMRPRFGENFHPECSILIPCKGIPKDLEKNLEGFLELDYPSYEVVYVVESENDPAVPFIKRITNKFSNARLVVAGLTKTCAQKNHNLLAAVNNVDVKSEILVFADSDIRPRKHWLKELVLPLADSKVTVTSGFRWLHSTKGTTGELTHSYVNIFMYVCFCAACYFGGVGLWGGSMAIRKRDFDAFKVAQKWSRAAVDDMSLSQIVLKNRKKAVIVPPCITHTDDLLQTVRGTVSWFERQIMYLKAYQKALWFFPTLFLALVAIVLIFLLPVSIVASMGENRSFLGLGGGAALVFYVGELLTALLYPFLGTMPRFHKFILLQPFMRLTHAYSYLKTWSTNTITWAGIRYKLDFRGDVAHIKRPEDC